MRIAFVPFLRQQDARTGRFLLESDSGVRRYSFLAEQCSGSLTLPPLSQCEDAFRPGCDVVRMPRQAPTPIERLIQWDSEWIKFLSSFDVVFLQHELLTWPLHLLAEDLPLIVEDRLYPDVAGNRMAGMFTLAWSSSSLLHSSSLSRTQHLTAHGLRAVHWPLGYSSSLSPPRNLERIHDVVYPGRISNANRAECEAALHAVSSVGCSAVFTDPTSFLHTATRPMSRADYETLLHSSKVVLSLRPTPGSSLLEAIAAGCIPVALRTPENEELLTREWPYFCNDTSPERISTALHAALADKQVVAPSISEYSYEKTWLKVKEDLQKIGVEV